MRSSKCRLLVWVCCILHVAVTVCSAKKKHNNILLILADDLGYGDTSVSPFIGLGAKTPNLEKMAERGTTLINYHTAAATCTPTRASILTGMYPWRIGIKAVFEYGERGKSNRDDWLPPLPTIPMVLGEANYSVAHSGKWHLGGMRNDDLTMRILPEKPVGAPGGKRCPHPGPNQQGFQNYASVLDGPGAPRQNHLQIQSRLYSEGCKEMLINDVEVKRIANNTVTGYLSYCEAEHAIRAMNQSVQENKPFYVQVWFHCPHGPLEEIPGWRHILPNKKKKALDLPDLYITMIADMDVQIGRMLHALETLGLEQDTLVVFTSDNGPEHFAGSSGGFRGQKRFIYEGGIRVPAIVQWVDTIPANVKSDIFAVSTDLFPTFLDAAGIKTPHHLRLDGISLLPQLIPEYFHIHGSAKAAPVTTKSSAGAVTSAIKTSVHSPGAMAKLKHHVEEVQDNQETYKNAVRDRVTLWHNDYEGPRRTAAWIYDYKVILDEKDTMSEMFDMRHDKFEKHNLIKDFAHMWVHYNFSTAHGHHVLTSMPGIRIPAKPITLEVILTERNNKDVHMHIASMMFRVLKDYATFGDVAYLSMKAAHPGWHYTPTLDSDYRIPGKRTNTPRVPREKLIEDNTCGVTPCTCAVKTASTVSTLPYTKLGEFPTKYLNPGKILDGAKLLKLRRPDGVAPS